MTMASFPDVSTIVTGDGANRTGAVCHIERQSFIVVITGDVGVTAAVIVTAAVVVTAVIITVIVAVVIIVRYGKAVHGARR